MGRKRNHKKEVISTKSPLEVAADSPLLTCQVSPIFGRHLSTKVDVQKGELLLKDKYLVVGPMYFSKVVCLGCHSDLSKEFVRFKCTKCSWPLCANKCQKSSFHAQECKFFAKHKILPPEDPDSLSYGAITVLRACLLKKTKPLVYSKLMSLEAHHEKRNKDLRLWDADVKHVVKVVRDEWKLGQEFTADDIHRISGILDVNGFEIGTNYPVLGVFGVTSLLAHDCVPNAAVFKNLDEGLMEVRAAVDIPKGIPVTICYNCALKPTAQRKKTLSEMKYFECNCNRCKDPTELGTHLNSLACLKCKKGAVSQIVEGVSPSSFNWGCDSCVFKMENRDVEILVNKYKAKAQTLEGIKDREEFLTECKNIFHTNHYIVLPVKYALCQAYGREEGCGLAELTTESLHRKLQLCHEVLKVLDVLTPGYSMKRGHILYELQAAEVELTVRQTDECGKDSIRELIQKRVAGTVDTLKEVITIFEFSPLTRKHAEYSKITLTELENWMASLNNTITQ